MQGCAIKRLRLAILITAICAMVFPMQGDPASLALVPRSSPELRADLIRRSGLDQRCPVQVRDFLLTVAPGRSGPCSGVNAPGDRAVTGGIPGHADPWGGALGCAVVPGVAHLRCAHGAWHCPISTGTWGARPQPRLWAAVSPRNFRRSAAIGFSTHGNRTPVSRSIADRPLVAICGADRPGRPCRGWDHHRDRADRGCRLFGPWRQDGGEACKSLELVLMNVAGGIEPGESWSGSAPIRLASATGHASTALNTKRCIKRC